MALCPNKRMTIKDVKNAQIDLNVIYLKILKNGNSDPYKL
jgi:hypothetical protein